MSVLSSISQSSFGVDTAYGADPVASTVGTSPTQLWRANPDRVELIFQNLSGNVVYIFPGPQVSVTRGFYLGANGGLLVFLAAEDGELVGQEFWGISLVASVIFTTEVAGA